MMSQSRLSPRREVSCVIGDNERLLGMTLADSLVRYGVRTMAVAYSAGDAVAQTLEHAPDALVVDLDFGPGPTGLDVAHKILSEIPKIGIVILTGYEDPRLLAPGLPEAPPGAVYLVKQDIDDPKRIAQAVRDAVAFATSDADGVAQKRRLDLTDSQAELLRLIATGMSNNAICEELVVSQGAVEKAITRLAKKLKVDRSSGANMRISLTHCYLEFIGAPHGSRP